MKLNGKSLRKFTIIELLIVIAVISILASLLLPALQKAKSKAKEIGCSSNLRQVYLAHNSYNFDYNGYFVFGKIHTENLPQGYLSPMRYWGGFLYYTYISSVDKFTYSDYKDLRTAFLCPEFNPNDERIFRPDLKGISYAYAMNEHVMLCGEDDYTNLNTGNNNIKNIKHPSSCMLTGENRYFFRYGYHPEDIYPAENLGWYYYHNGAQNILYVDGHVSRLKINKMPVWLNNNTESKKFWTGKD